MKRGLVLIPAVLLFCACFPASVEDVVVSGDKQLEQHDETVDLYIEETETVIASTVSRAPRKASFEREIRYVARILPVQVDGVAVQANDIVVSGTTAYIAANRAGEEFKGALQIVDITDPGNPVIEEEIKFRKMDINTLEIQGSLIFFGGQADPDAFNGNRSFTGYLDTAQDIDPASIMSSIVWLDSYATTAIARKGDNYYVATGAMDGSLHLLDSGLNTLERIALADIRDLKAHQSGVILIAGTTDNDEDNGRVILYGNDLNTPDRVFQIDDFQSPYHKSTVEVHQGRYALLGLADAGMLVIDTKDDAAQAEIVFELSNPVVGDTLESDANSVSTDGSYIFTANGEYGFRVLRLLSLSGHDSAFAEMVGYYSFSDEGLMENGYQYSANHIEYKANHLFVACGAGGVMIFYLS